MFKKIFAFMIALVMIVSVGTTVFADDSDINNHNSEGVPLSEEIIEQIAIEWASSTNPETDIQVGDVIKLYGYDNNLCGASISYVSNGIPYGYIVLDFSTDSIVTEYVIEEGAQNICNAILENARVDSSVRTKVEQIAKIYKTTPFNYAVSIEENGVKSFYDSVKGNISIQEFNAERNVYTTKTKSTPVNHWGDIIIGSIPSGYTTVDGLSKLSTTASLTEADIKRDVKKYACVVQAMANVAKQSGLLKNNSVVDTYNYLWTESDTTVDKVENGITYGSTKFNKMGPSLVALAKSLGKKNSSYSNNSSPTYGTFKNAVSAGKSSIFGAGVEYTNGERVGHAVSVVGNRSAKDSSGKLYQYIYIADGWYSTLRYICISDTQYFKDTYSTVLTFK